MAEARSGLLKRDGVVVALTPKTFEVLLVLLRRAGDLVTKEDLLAAVWPDAFVEENNLARHVSTLRKALDEQPDSHRYVVTVPGRGYRFVADVVDLTPPPAAPAPADAERADSTQTVHRPPPVSVPVPLVPRRSWGLIAGVVVVTAVVAAGVTWLARRSTPLESSPPRALRQLTFEPGLNAEPAFSPDGRWIAYATDENGNSDIWLAPVAGGERVRVTSSAAHEWQPAWSPDGRTLVYRSERDGGGLYTVPAFGGSERRLTAFGFRPRWSPDGQTILFYNSALQTVRESPTPYVVGSGGGVPRRLQAHSQAPAGSLRVGWHPDGRVSAWRYRTGGGWTFSTSALDGTQSVESAIAPDVERRLDEAGVIFSDFVWAPSGRALYFEGVSNGVGNVWRITVDPRTLAWTGGPDRLTTGAGRDTGLTISSDGTRMAFGIRSDRTRLWALPFDVRTGRLSGDGLPLSPDGADVGFHDVSAHGAGIVYRVARRGSEALWARTWEAGSERLLVEAGGEHAYAMPRWSRDGARLALVRTGLGIAQPAFRERWAAVTETSQSTTWILEADGTMRSVPPALGDVFLVGDWSRDGASLLGSCGSLTGDLALCLAASPGSDGVPAASPGAVIAAREGGSLYQGRFSPDDRWVSFTAIDMRDPGVARIYAMRREGGPWVPLTDGRAFDDKGRWSADGRWVYYVSNRSGFLNVFRQRFDPVVGAAVGGAEQLTVFDTPGRMILPSIGEMELSVTRDRFVLPLTGASGQIWILDQVDR